MEITLHHAIDVLNDALGHDQRAISKLVQTRVDCSMTLADHPTIQVLNLNGRPQVGLLGILNGIFTSGSNDKKYIGIEIEEGIVKKFFVFSLNPIQVESDTGNS